MPRHFSPEAEKMYGYEARKGEDESNLIYPQNPKSLSQVGRLVRNNAYYWWKRRKFPAATW